jgi:hypothetical protein
MCGELRRFRQSENQLTTETQRHEENLWNGLPGKSARLRLPVSSGAQGTEATGKGLAGAEFQEGAVVPSVSSVLSKPAEEAAAAILVAGLLF